MVDYVLHAETGIITNTPVPTVSPVRVHKLVGMRDGKPVEFEHHDLGVQVRGINGKPASYYVSQFTIDGETLCVCDCFADMIDQVADPIAARRSEDMSALAQFGIVDIRDA
ncbi:MAG TPA: hypothetical protein VGV37_06280 [Aliidongia sp.]|uniref:hypothetical protein n=1 Tax=Aliidongia sp. TaxID=1914230 RepID=UPI002DDCFD25|nr:hypothetical protein [Aliidongia sp.]HEV2674132.1 hypothetical protein [Aliidongia sp.]